MHAPAHFVKATSRLPKLLSVTTIALVLALLFALLSAKRSNSHGSGSLPAIPGLPSLFVSRAPDSVVGWRTREATPARVRFEYQLDALAGSLDSLAIALDHHSSLASRRAFHRARLAYKRSESLLEPYSPTTAHALNGPLGNDDGDAPSRPLESPAAFRQSSPHSHRSTRGTRARRRALSPSRCAIRCGVFADRRATSTSRCCQCSRARAPSSRASRRSASQASISMIRRTRLVAPHRARLQRRERVSPRASGLRASRPPGAHHALRESRRPRGCRRAFAATRPRLRPASRLACERRDGI